MTKKTKLVAALKKKGIEFNPKAKIAELEALNAEPVESAPEDTAPVDSVEPEVSDESPTESAQGKKIEGSLVVSTKKNGGYTEAKTAVGCTYKLLEAEYNAL